MGALAPNGNTVADFWAALQAGRSGIATITHFDPANFSAKIAGEVNSFNPADHFENRELRKLDPFSVYALVAAEEAIRDARLDSGALDGERVGVILGSGVGGVQTLEEQQKVLLERGPRRVTPFFVPRMIVNIAAAQVAIRWGFKGPNYTIVSACASANDAIGSALRLIQYGDMDVVITGGTEASVTPLTIAGFGNMKALSTRNDDPPAASRPFDAERDGFVLGEGAGILVLEAEQHALSRGAEILAAVSGYGATDDAHHITQPAEGGQGSARAMQLALRDGDLQPEDIDYINAHGTSTQFNDKSETAAIKTVFGAHAPALKISSTKSMTGHLLGASGAVAAIAVVETIRHNSIPPTINYTTPDPECDLDYVPNRAQDHPVNAALVNAFGFGGHNAVILIHRWTA